MAKFQKIIMTEKFLDENKDVYFIFGDNLIHQGYGGAAKLRDHPHAIGFITKKFPDNNDNSFYRPDEYHPIFDEELEKLEKIIKTYSNKKFYISKLGSELANKFLIWEKIIHKNLILKLSKYNNVIFCWEN
jgi:hypothetical protein